jgi:hypothetical protein
VCIDLLGINKHKSIVNAWKAKSRGNLVKCTEFRYPGVTNKEKERIELQAE